MFNVPCFAIQTRKQEDVSLIKRSYPNATKNRLTRILKSMEETPFSGFASPEALKYELSGKWSRELSKKDRVIYSIEYNIIKIHSLPGQSDK